MFIKKIHISKRLITLSACLLFAVIITNDVKGICEIKQKNKTKILPVDRKARPEVIEILNWAVNVSDNDSNRIISGQYSYASCEAIAQLTGNKWPALMEETFWQKNNSPDEWITGWERADDAKKHCLEYWEKGGLVSIHMPVPNPFNKTNQHDTTKPDDENWNDVFVKGTNAHINLTEWVDILAEHLKWLQDYGIVAIIRPFHENTGAWFWYGTPRYNGEQFARLYKWFFNYLTQEKQLHNLIFSYSPNIAPYNVMDYYPGDKYVDFISIDSYTTPVLNDVAANSINEIRKASSKPFGLSEMGWNAREIPFYERDSREYIEAIKKTSPDAFYFSIWGGSNAPCRQNNTKELYNDPWIITRDEVNWK